VTNTIDIALNGKPHEVASAFFFGREDVIPDMFRSLLGQAQFSDKAERLVHYLQRHIEVDGDSHGPLSELLLEHLCEGDPVKLAEAQRCAEKCLQARIVLWDGVSDKLKAKHGNSK